MKDHLVIQKQFFERFGNKIVVSFRILDVKTNEIKRHKLMEFVDMPVELSKMIDIAIKDLLGVEYDNKLKAILMYVESTEDIIVSDVRNSGTRMGIGVVNGLLARRIQDPRSTGGRDGSPVMSQMGYQFEKQYLNAGDFHALAEMLVMVSGLEQQMFAPSLVFMNGFRLSKSGWEVAFGPNFRILPTSMGFYDDAGEFGTEGKYWTEREFRNFYNETPVSEDKLPTYKKHLDSRGSLSIRTGWVWSIGKTFKSGYLNIPINIYVAPSEDGLTYGASLGFNIRKAKKD